MNRNLGKALVIAAAVAAVGCSSNRHDTVRVSYAKPGYSAPGNYYTDSEYTDPAPAYDREYTATQTTSTYLAPHAPTTSTSTPRVTATRTVAMPATTGRHDITLDEFRGHVNNQSAIIVDAREPKHFNKGHVRGAINIPAGDEDAYMAKFRKDVGSNDLIIVYCGGPDCPAGDNVATYLNTQGFTNLRVYKPGWQQLSKMDLD